MSCTITGKTMDDYLNELPRNCKNELKGILKNIRSGEITVSDLIALVTGNCTIVEGIFVRPFVPQFV